MCYIICEIRSVPQFVCFPSAGAEEYIDGISAERYDSPNECPGYDTKQSDGEASVMQEL